MNSRNFEKIILGRSYWQAPIIFSRICNDHNISHNLVSVIAVESACGIPPTEQTKKLRRLMLSAENIRNHTQKIFFAHLPDFVDLKHPDNHHLVQDFENLTQFSNLIIETLCGRRSHSITSVVGGFKKLPEKNSFRKIIESSEEAQKSAERTLKMIASVDGPEKNTSKVYCTLHDPDDYPLISKEIWSSNGEHFSTNKYHHYLIEERLAGNGSVTLAGKATCTGPEARYNQNKKRISKSTQELLTNLQAENNSGLALATSIELHHFVVEAIESCRNFSRELKKEHQLLPVSFGIGTGAVESSDGLMIHHCKIDKDGMIEKYDIVTPSEMTDDKFLRCQYCLGH